MWVVYDTHSTPSWGVTYDFPFAEVLNSDLEAPTSRAIVAFKWKMAIKSIILSAEVLIQISCW